jgi:hypothetical protein
VVVREKNCKINLCIGRLRIDYPNWDLTTKIVKDVDSNSQLPLCYHDEVKSRLYRSFFCINTAGVAVLTALEDEDHLIKVTNLVAQALELTLACYYTDRICNLWEKISYTIYSSSCLYNVSEEGPHGARRLGRSWAQ